MRMWHDEPVRRRASMHVDTIRSHQKAADGTVREYRSHLLRHSFRDEQGRPRKETLANLTALPDAALEAVRKVLRGEAAVSPEGAFEVERSVPARGAAAAHSLAARYGLLTDPWGRQVAGEVFAGTPSAPIPSKPAIPRVRDHFGIKTLIMAGDRGMIPGTRIADLRELPGMDGITPLRAPAVAALAAD